MERKIIRLSACIGGNAGDVMAEIPRAAAFIKQRAHSGSISAFSRSFHVGSHAWGLFFQAIARRTRDKNRRTGVLLCDLTGVCGYLLAEGHPCLIAHGIVCPGLKGPPTESLLFPERIVSTAFG